MPSPLLARWRLSFLPALALLGLLGCGDGGHRASSDDDDDGEESGAEDDPVARDGGTSDADEDACSPRSCRAGECGAVDDGCGGTLACSECAEAGADRTLSLTADARSVMVSGTLSQPGVPLTSALCAKTHSLTFTETTRNSQVQVVARCQFTDVGFTFSVQLYPGTYSISAGSLGVVGQVIVKDAPITDLKLEGYEIQVAGKILYNHTQYAGDTCSNMNVITPDSWVIWTDLQTKKETKFRVTCYAGWSYAGTLVPGTYRVEFDAVRNDNSSVGFPDPPMRVLESVEIGNAPLTRTVDLDVVLGTLTGTVTQNGQAISDVCGFSQTPSVTLTELKSPATTFSLLVSCGAGGGWTFSNNRIYAGTYAVKYGQTGSGPSSQQLPIAGELTIQEGTTSLTIAEYKVAGTVTYNGMVPPANSGAGVVFTDRKTGLQRSIYPTYSPESAAFSGSLPAGTYDVKVWHNGAVGYLPLATPVVVTGPLEGLAWDFVGLRISGSISRNQMPVVGTTCRASSDAATVLFTNLETKLEYPLPITCDTSKGWLFAGLLPAGTYRAELRADYAGSPFKGAAKLLASELMIQGDGSSYTLNAPAAIKISGAVTHNGQPIADRSLSRTGTDDCANWLFAFDSAGEKTVTRIPLTCKSGMLRIEGSLYQGTYAVSAGVTAEAAARKGAAPLPLPVINGYVVDPALGLTQERSDLTFDLKTRLVNLEVTRDGQPITDKTCSMLPYMNAKEYDHSYAVFTSLTSGEASKHQMGCDGTRWSVQALVYPDSYRVDILPAPKASLAPAGSFRAFDRLVVE